MKRTSLEIKKEILKLLKKSPKTFAELERKVNSSFQSIKSNCKELQFFGFIKVSRKKHHVNGRIANFVSLTKKGKEFQQQP